MRSVVQVDEANRRIVKVLEDPVEAHKATFEWLWQKLPYPCIVVDGDVDIEAQTIGGVPIGDIYARNEGQFIQSFIV